MKSYFTVIVDVSTLYDESGSPSYNSRQELLRIKPICMLCALSEQAEDLDSNSRLSKDYDGIFDATISP